MDLWQYFEGIIAGKGAMGMGDIKNLWHLFGLFHGFKKILDITLLAFLISAIVAIGIIIYRKRKK